MPATTQAEYDRTLYRLKGILRRRKNGWLIPELAIEMGCTRSIAYRRVKALIKREGASVWSCWAGERGKGKPGPLPKYYGIRD